ncbi:MAG TPA: AI-2E family transporter [Candidatus Kryptonia bacterium]
MRSIFKKNSFKVFLLIVFLLAALWFVSLLGSVFILFLLAILSTFLLSPLVEFLETRGVKRVYGILLIYGSIIAVIYGLVRTFLPPLLAQVVSLENAIKSPDFNVRVQAIQTELQSKLSFINFGNLSEKFNELTVELADKWVSIITSAGSVAMILVIVPFVTFFLLKDSDMMIRGMIALVPNKYFEMTLNIVQKIGIQLGIYIRAWLTEAAIVGTLSILGLLLIGVKYAVIIGVVAGVANLIPYLGPIVGAVPAIVVSLIQTGNLSMLVPILILFVAIRVADDIVIVPLVYSRSTSMHPLTIVVLILVAGELKGIVGMVLAMPLYTVLRVIAKETLWGLRSYSILKSGTGKSTLQTG